MRGDRCRSLRHQCSDFSQRQHHHHNTYLHHQPQSSITNHYPPSPTTNHCHYTSVTKPLPPSPSSPPPPSFSSPLHHLARLSASFHLLALPSLPPPLLVSTTSQLPSSSPLSILAIYLPPIVNSHVLITSRLSSTFYSLSLPVFFIFI